MPVHRKITKAVIPAAGFGTRMLPATKTLPKEMLPVTGKPLIQYALEEAVASGIETVVLVTRNHKSAIQTHFGADRELEYFLVKRKQAAAAKLVHRLGGGADIRYVEQEKPLGLAHAITCARPIVGDEAFAVLLPDVIIVDGEPVTRQLIRAHEQHGGSVVGCSRDRTSGNGAPRGCRLQKCSGCFPQKIDPGHQTCGEAAAKGCPVPNRRVREIPVGTRHLERHYKNRM
jgi:UTP--glucose-1-phosphate uridylyltransferase